MDLIKAAKVERTRSLSVKLSLASVKPCGGGIRTGWNARAGIGQLLPESVSVREVLIVRLAVGWIYLKAIASLVSALG